MNLYDTIALTTIMILLAAIPSSSVALVVIRTSTMGIKHGIGTSLGVVSGDLIFVTMALFGLTALSEQLGSLFVIIRYLAAAYLIWFGISLIKNHDPKVDSTSGATMVNNKRTMSSSYLSGLLLTLSDIKAVFFYASLFPTFINPSSLSIIDFTVIIGITLFTVGGIKVLYVFSARKMMTLSRGLPFQTKAKPLAGTFMIATGGYLLAKY